MVEVTPVGAVPDEVLLLCGRPDPAPSAWWTPALDRRGQHDAARLVATMGELLTAQGVRDAATGELRGLLGEVAAVVADARVLLLLETERPGAAAERRSVVVAPDRAVLDLQDPEGGVHDLLLADPRSACALVAELLQPPVASAPPSGAVRALAGTRRAAEVVACLPVGERHATTRVVRTAGGADAVSHAVTVVHHPAGAVACWALPDGALEVQVLDDDLVTELALALLGAELEPVA